MSDRDDIRRENFRPPADPVEETIDAAGSGALPHEDFGTIDRYRLLSKLGEGGMGQVWLAEQTEPVHRQVALKLIRAGRYDRRAQDRFQLERQSLAIMDHPAIAKVFDAGSTAEGQPYFVMEYVQGLPITTYCDQKKLTTRQRLKLFTRVCEGVQHAHQKAIIHRDLKPSNVLIVEVDGKPVPRIIDFGIAKTAARGEDETLVTGAGAMVGTPGYISPEQTDPAIADVDTRADVYSLGVILYELLTGFLPFDPRQWKKKPLHEVLRQLQEEDPPSPSTKVSSDDNRGRAAAENRRTEPRQLATTLRGDLDWIALKALERDRQRRYGTPIELAGDIEHYLQNEPVGARPATSFYRFRKYAARHRLAVGAAAGLLILLTAFGLTQFMQVRKITRERDRANRIADFMSDMFKVSDPNHAQGAKVTAREILDNASREIETGLARDPDVQSQLMYTMAQTYSNLGLFSKARELAEKVLDERTRRLGKDDPLTLASRLQEGTILERMGKFNEAETITRAAAEDAQRRYGEGAPISLDAMESLAIVLEKQGQYKAEEELLQKVLAARIRTQGPESAAAMKTKSNLGGALRYEGRFSEAEPLFREVIETERRTLGSRHPQTISSMNNLANMLQEAGRYDEAEVLQRQVIQLETEVLGPDHPFTISSTTNLGNTILHGTTRFREAEAIYRKSLEASRRALGEDHPYTVYAMEGLANTLSVENQYAEAEQLHRQILAIRERTLGPEHTDTLLSQFNLADVLLLEKRDAEANDLLRKTLPVQVRTLGADDADTLATQAELARVMVDEKRYAEAETLARATWTVQCKKLGVYHADSMSTLVVLSKALIGTGRYPEVRSLFETTISQVEQLHAPALPMVWHDYGWVAVIAKDYDAAIDHLRKAVALGYDAGDLADQDEMKPLLDDPRFKALTASTRK